MLKRNVFYRDILVGNIILEESKNDGFLINRKEALGVLSKTSTKVFIAIGVLYSKNYNFIYNLELFF